MAMKCFLCKKGTMVGKQHAHHKGVAGQRWSKRAPKTQKIFKPNLHSTRIALSGGFKRVKLCTKCLRTYKNSLKEKVSKLSSQPQATVS